jgi:hypothetical protein
MAVNEIAQEAIGPNVSSNANGFNPIQIKNGLVVRMDKNGTIRSVLGKYGEHGKESSMDTKRR